MRVQTLGVNGMVTGSSTLVTTPDGLNILIDCGFVQDNSMSFEKVQKINSREFEGNISELDYIILTHAHL